VESIAQTPRALVVDDEPGALAELSGALAAQGVQAVMASDRASALRTLTDAVDPIDVLVVDLGMPGGEALVQAVHRMGGERELPIVVLTAANAPAADPRVRRESVVRKCEGPERVAEVAAALARLARNAAEAAARAAEAAARIAESAARAAASEDTGGHRLGKIALARRQREA